MKLFLLLSVLPFISPIRAETPETYQKAARTAFESQMAQRGKDCPDARTTLDQNSCLANVQSATERDFDRFYNSLSALLPPADRQKLDATQADWKRYATDSCDAVGDLYRGGTIAPSAVTGCKILLQRSRMQDLNSIYYTVLHN